MPSEDPAPQSADQGAEKGADHRSDQHKHKGHGPPILGASGKGSTVG